MARRHSPKNTQPIYSIRDWEIIEESFNPDYHYRNETVFALANGTIGTRGTFEEGYISDGVLGLEGTFLNGFYETEPIRYPEPAFGYPQKSQTMLNVANAKIILIEVEGDIFSLHSGEILDYRRTLNLKDGVLSRRVLWRSPKGHEILVETSRFVSASNRHLMVIDLSLTPQNFAGYVRIASLINGDVKNLVTENDPRAGSGLQGRVLDVQHTWVQDGITGLDQQTHHSKLRYATVCAHTITTDAVVKQNAVEEAFQVGMEFRLDLQAQQTVRVTKFIAYVSDRHTANPDLLWQAVDVVKDAQARGYEAVLNDHQATFADFWHHADIAIEGDALLQQGLRFNLFHLFQSVGRDGLTNIGAKGLTGEGYEGHYFWDTEMYVLPVLLYIRPQIARKLLEYRHSILPNARQRAIEMGHRKGALFPWRSINGDECSSYFPAGTAQYHINADVAFALKRYIEATGDFDYLAEQGAEMLFETARVWLDFGVYIEDKGFCLNGVTGPDEYTAVVNNNAYTNLMAQENLYYAYHVARWMSEKHPETFQTLCHDLMLWAEEIEAWKDAADNMYVPYDEQRKLFKQDDSFFDKAIWDFENTPADHYPLLLHYHPLTIYRYQVCKQADFVLAMYLLGNRFTREEKQRNYDYYEAVTTHDSSLSSCIFSIVANEIGYAEKAYDYFNMTARMDLEDYHRNVKDGVHIANMAGTWMGVVNGFAGFRVEGDYPSFKPTLPQQWQGYAFNLTFRNTLFRVHVQAEQVTYTLIEGETLTVLHHDNPLELVLGEAKSVSRIE